MGTWKDEGWGMLQWENWAGAESEWGALLSRRTVQDRMTGCDMRLTDEQMALVQRLQRGQFGDVNFNPYEVGRVAAAGPGHRGT